MGSLYIISYSQKGPIFRSNNVNCTSPWRRRVVRRWRRCLRPWPASSRARRRRGARARPGRRSQCWTPKWSKEAEFKFLLGYRVVGDNGGFVNFIFNVLSCWQTGPDSIEKNLLKNQNALEIPVLYTQLMKFSSQYNSRAFPIGFSHIESGPGIHVYWKDAILTVYFEQTFERVCKWSFERIFLLNRGPAAIW